MILQMGDCELGLLFSGPGALRSAASAGSTVTESLVKMLKACSINRCLQASASSSDTTGPNCFATALRAK